VIAARDAAALERGLAFLDEVPDGLYLPIVTHPLGDLRERAAAVLALRAALLEGRLPDALAWPAPPLGEALLGELRDLGIAPFCRGEPDLTDAVLATLLEAALVATERRDARLRALLARLRAKVKRAAVDPEAEAAAGDQAATEAQAEALGRLHERWAPLVATWREIAEIFGALGRLVGSGWDLGRGVLASYGWLEVKRLQAVLDRLPQLRELVQTLGRMQASLDEAEPAVLERIFAPVRRAGEELREVRSPLAPTEARGIQRCDDVSRMLPAEAALLGHRLLRLVWHARRAERMLVSYRFEGLLTDRVAADESAEVESPRPALQTERGPILVCLDTSGSMRGLPETITKAITIEAMRVAHAEGRRCYLYAFSGPKDVAETELDLSPGGLEALLAFLAQSFHGGTDVEEPLRRATARLGEEAWRRADILLVSDGEFAVSPAVVATVAAARAAHGLRVHGVLAGSAEHEIARVCDHLHRFAEWGVMVGVVSH
jgi:uncharacterized protein with von Willebrand factor type A (vWA) domain